MPQFCILLYANDTILATQRGAMAQWPPLNTHLRSSLEPEVRGSNLRPVKSDTVLPTAHHHSDISSKDAVLPEGNDTKMGPANSLQASA